MGDLTAAKMRVTNAVLGRHGVHGVGVDAKKQSVNVYISADEGADRRSLLAAIRELAKPFSVHLIEEQRPKIS